MWGGFGRQEEEVGQLDFTEGAPGSANGDVAAAVELGASRMEEEEEPEYEVEVDEEELLEAAKGSKVGKERTWHQR